MSTRYSQQNSTDEGRGGVPSFHIYFSRSAASCIENCSLKSRPAFVYYGIELYHSMRVDFCTEYLTKHMHTVYAA